MLSDDLDLYDDIRQFNSIEFGQYKRINSAAYHSPQKVHVKAKKSAHYLYTTLKGRPLLS